MGTNPWANRSAGAAPAAGGDAEERAGLGFAVMQSFMDKVKVSSTPGRGTRVTLTKRLDARA